MLVEWREQTIGETSCVQRRPKAITRPRKVMAHGGGVKSGIDAAEKDAHVGRDQIANGLAGGSNQLFFGWLPGLSQTMRRCVRLLLNFKTCLLRSALL